MWFTAASQLVSVGKGRVHAGFTHRTGNLGLHVGDQSDAVVQRRTEVAQEFAGVLSDWVCGEQVHEDHVAIVTESDKGSGSREYRTSIPRSDAMITRERDLTLVTFAADCVPCLFYDEANQAIGVAHAGWKGTLRKLPAQTVQTMCERFGSKAENVWVALGPAIADCCYEVDTRVYNEFRDAYPEALEFFRQTKTDKFHVDLREIIEASLQQIGVDISQMERVGRCTSCENEKWFSHRKEKGSAGRHAGLIRLSS